MATVGFMLWLWPAAIALAPVAVPATLSGSIVNGQFHLSITCQPGFTYAILTSTDLGGSWVSISTNTASAGGTIKFTDTNSPTFNLRFYRTMRLSP